MLLAALAACSSSAGSGSSSPNSAGSASAVPGGLPKLGQGSAGAITVTSTSIVRRGALLTITMQIHNDEAVDDELVTAGSQVSATLTLSPPLRIPAGGTVSVGGASANSLVLTQNSRLEPDGTILLTLQFGKAGAVQVFSSFHDTH
jgi:copper(I)-binding protein